MTSAPLALGRTEVALCNGVRGLKYLPPKFVSYRLVVALCNGVRGLKCDYFIKVEQAWKSHSVMECVD